MEMLYTSAIYKIWFLILAVHFFTRPSRLVFKLGNIELDANLSTMYGNLGLE